MKTIAVIAAAGSGKRFKGPLPKQFVKADGMELIARAVSGFEKEKSVGGILIVAAPDFIRFVERNIAAKYGFKKVIGVIPGGRERWQSVYNAVNYLKEIRPDNVLIHDAARPVFGKTLVKRILAGLRRYPAVIPVAKISATVKTIRGGIIKGTIDRGSLRTALTPQGFKFARLEKFYTAAAVKRHKPTDEALIFEKSKAKVMAVEEEGFNIKVTTRQDLEIVEALLKARKRRGKK
ncbi:MAG TPA: 2-C-methyl-D-erythritol 4-phosphate cytidylyltransferase [bacterium]|nr:2-C-methyl-D-erythritol 4-phosphate cytidylyltransferase [bacterium]